MYKDWLKKIETIPADELSMNHFQFIIDQMADTPEQWEDFVQLARKMGQRGYLSLKHQLFKEALDIQADDDLILEIIQDKINWEEFDQAETWFQDLTAPEAYSAQLLAAQLAVKQDKSSVAIRLLQNLIKSEPTRWPAYWHLAELYDTLDLQEQAQTYYEVLVNYFEDFVDLDAIQLKLASYAMQAEIIDLPEVEKLIETSDEESTEALFLLAQAQYQGQEYDQALDTLEDLLALDRDHIDAYELLASIAFMTQEDEALYQALTWLFETLPTDDGRLYGLIEMAQARDLIDPLLADKIKESAYFIEDPLALLHVLEWLIAYHLEADHIDQAVSLVEEFSEILADPEAFSYLYGLIYLAQGEEALALSALDLAYDYQLIPVDGLPLYLDLLEEAGRKEDLAHLLETNTLLDSTTIARFDEKLSSQTDRKGKA